MQGKIQPPDITATIAIVNARAKELIGKLKNIISSLNKEVTEFTP